MHQHLTICVPCCTVCIMHKQTNIFGLWHRSLGIKKSMSYATRIYTNSLKNNHHFHFNGPFPGERGSGSSSSSTCSRMVPLDTKHRFLHARCPSCVPTNSVQALTKTQSTDHNQWPFLHLPPDSWGKRRWSLYAVYPTDAMLLSVWNETIEFEHVTYISGLFTAKVTTL